MGNFKMVLISTEAHAALKEYCSNKPGISYTKAVSKFILDGIKTADPELVDFKPAIDDNQPQSL